MARTLEQFAQDEIAELSRNETLELSSAIGLILAIGDRAGLDKKYVERIQDKLKSAGKSDKGSKSDAKGMDTLKKSLGDYLKDPTSDKYAQRVAEAAAHATGMGDALNQTLDLAAGKIKAKLADGTRGVVTKIADDYIKVEIKDGRKTKEVRVKLSDGEWENGRSFKAKAEKGEKSGDRRSSKKDDKSSSGRLSKRDKDRKSSKRDRSSSKDEKSGSRSSRKDKDRSSSKKDDKSGSSKRDRSSRKDKDRSSSKSDRSGSRSSKERSGGRDKSGAKSGGRRSRSW